mmetsp:Transcript_93301/g.221870  ORF Transcript_93301/g.221870 Transcript_93301/m.221870 type:complete len:225 (+) Transcript_93301:427-1101(+)
MKVLPGVGWASCCVLLARAGVLHAATACREASTMVGIGTVWGDGKGAAGLAAICIIRGEAMAFAWDSKLDISLGARMLTRMVTTPAHASKLELIRDSSTLPASSGSGILGLSSPSEPKRDKSDQQPESSERKASSTVRYKVFAATRATRPDASTSAAAAAASSSSAASPLSASIISGELSAACSTCGSGSSLQARGISLASSRRARGASCPAVTSKFGIGIVLA